MAKKMTDDEIGKEIEKALNRLEIATDLLKAWIGYMNSDLTETEEILVQKSKEFLGVK